jgi:hypothetical protein
MRFFGMSVKGGIVVKSRCITPMLRIELEVRESDDGKKSLYLK